MTEVCGTCGHGHTTDLGSLNASACADHGWTDACPFVGIACPPAVERADVIAALSRRYATHLDGKLHDLFVTNPSLIPKPLLAEPITYQDIVDLMSKIRDMPPRRTEPIKLTPGQWAMLAHGTPTPPSLYTPLGDLMGIPVFMVNTEAESTPVAEGWIKRKPWWVRLWRKMRGKR